MLKSGQTVQRTMRRGDRIFSIDGLDHVRLRAVDMVIGNLIKLRELGDLEERIAALEELTR